jgi:hypothetical protein
MSNESTTSKGAAMTTALRTDTGYCSKSDDDKGQHNCEQCSLCNYGLDCRNNKTTETDTPYYLLSGVDRERAEVRQGVK